MNLYFIDTNCLIQAKNEYYPFDFAPSFWEQLGNAISGGTVLIHEAVFQELMKKDDELKEWAVKYIKGKRISMNDMDSMRALSRVLDHVSDSPHYDEQGFHRWADDGIADPQLIASAIVHKATIVTREKATVKGQTRKMVNPKIPDVAADLGVRCIDPFQMMRELGFKL